MSRRTKWSCISNRSCSVLNVEARAASPPSIPRSIILDSKGVFRALDRTLPRQRHNAHLAQLLPLEQVVEGTGFDELGPIEMNSVDRADHGSIAAKYAHGSAAGRAIVVAIDQPAENVLQARWWLAVDAKLDCLR